MSEVATKKRIKQRRIYSDEDKATALAAYDSNGGDAAKTSREIQIPRTTIISWAQERGVHSDVANLRLRKRGELADRLEEVAWMLTDELSNEDLLERANLQQVATALGITIDKMRLLRGETTENVGIKVDTDSKQDAGNELDEWRQQQLEVISTAKVLNG